MQQMTKKQKILDLIAGRNPGALSWLERKRTGLWHALFYR
jgi:hypothetical protein